MNVLILGGTGFVGRHIAETALASGHTVTLFNRGVTDDSLFPTQRHLRGDRTGDVRVLGETGADVVIDTSGYTPDEVRASASAVAATGATYVFVSSVDAYDLRAPVIDESSATKTLPDGATTSERLPELYGAHKVRCEDILEELLGPERVMVVRAGLMIGPYDTTDRFTYWPVRVAAGGEILVPESRAMPVQAIDARDVAEWIFTALAAGARGTFNLVGTPEALTFGSILDAACAVAGTQPDFRWASSAFLQAHDVGAWVEMPLWLPESPEFRGLRNVRNDRARATGLRIRPLERTVADILADYRLRPRPLRAGLTREREAELLEHLRTERT